MKSQNDENQARSTWQYLPAGFSRFAWGGRRRFTLRRSFWWGRLNQGVTGGAASSVAAAGVACVDDRRVGDWVAGCPIGAGVADMEEILDDQPPIAKCTTAGRTITLIRG